MAWQKGLRRASNQILGFAKWNVSGLRETISFQLSVPTIQRSRARVANGCCGFAMSAAAISQGSDDPQTMVVLWCLAY